MIASRLHTIVFLSTTLGFALGMLPSLGSMEFLIQLTPSGIGLASRLDGAAAVGFNFALILTTLSIVLYSITNKSDLEAVEAFEWYGCLMFGGALAASLLGLTVFLWSESFPSISYGREARAFYDATFTSELWLYVVCLALFLVGGFGLYLLAKVPLLFRRRYF